MCPLAAFNYVIKTMSVLKPVLFPVRVISGRHFLAEN